jgi:hypothetical protein
MLLAWSVPAQAGDPKYEYGKHDDVKDVKEVEWKASAQAGVIMTTGNSRTTTGAAGAKASRKEGNNKFEVEANGAYARAGIWLAEDRDASGFIEANEDDLVTRTSTRAWLLKARYDRFLTEHNSLYVTALGSGDKPAGKDFVGGGQLGYSRQLYKDDKHELKGEAGYDFSYENLVGEADALSIHSARLFVGYEGTVSKDTGVLGSVESLHNVNTLDAPGGEVGAFEDTRVNATMAITTKLFENLSFRFSFTAKYDHAPAPRPPFGTPYAADYVPLAEELDTKTEATLIYSFL